MLILQAATFLEPFQNIILYKNFLTKCKLHTDKVFQLWTLSTQCFIDLLKSLSQNIKKSLCQNINDYKCYSLCSDNWNHAYFTSCDFCITISEYNLI